jgi:biotin synthase-related radical SAM superfamily protein
MTEACLLERIRVSTGSAIVLGLLRGRLDAKPTTIYLLTYRDGKCSANCGFCPQSRTSKGRADMLSRVTWPLFPTRQVLSRIERIGKTDAIKRVCVQALNYPTVFDDILILVREIKSRVKVPISVSCQPLNLDKMKTLAEAGVDRISIALDAATEEIFDKIKGKLVGGPYVWEKQREALREAVKVFGEGSVTTHLIVGLGETEEEMVQMIQWCVDLGIYPGLFAFTPIPGTLLENSSQPSLSRYRRVQIAHYLITHGKTRCENMTFDDDGCLIDFGVSGEQLREVIDTGEPFVTSGCPGCNRPYYNEKPSGPIYNYPRQPLPEEIAEIDRQIGILCPKPVRPSY